MVAALSSEHMRARAQMIGAEGERWKKHHANALGKLPPGTSVLMDIATGEYVTGATWQEADAAYIQRFGKLQRLSFSYTVDRPIFVGGGIWLK